jgi:hypothetical protein
MTYVALRVQFTQCAHMGLRWSSGSFITAA